jgi:type IV secretory pathway component VirB8
MESDIKKIQIDELIKKGDYYNQAMKWYRRAFISPVLERSLTIIILCILICISVIILFNLRLVLPMSKQLRYAIEMQDNAQMKADITKVNDNSIPVSDSIAEILIKNYVSAREKYKYSKLMQQYEYIYNSSTDSVYNEFKNDMGLNNPNSPILKYQKNLIRKIYISSIGFFNDNVLVYFSAKLYNSSGDIVEDSNWKVTVKFAMDDVNVYETKRFNFVVTDYQQELLK